MIGRRGSAPGNDVEVELKYRLSAVAAGERYLTAEELAGLRPVSRVRTTQLEDRYLDTADGVLARAGFAARLRVSTAGTVVSVKSLARQQAGSALHRREEIEGPADRTSSPRDWPASAARSLMLELCGDAPLIEVVTIRQLRRHRELRDVGTVVELSLDEVDVVARSRLLDRFAELEIELVRGDEQRLVEVAAVLDADAALDGTRGSKFEAALAAVRTHVRRHGPLPAIEVATERASAKTGSRDPDGVPPAPRAATSVRRGSARRTGLGRPPRRVTTATPAPPSDGGGASAVDHAPGELARRRGVDPGDSVADVRATLLRRELKALAAAEAAVRARGDAADVAAARSAVRRLLGAWTFFSAASPDGEPYAPRLTALLDRIESVRELDIVLAAPAAATAPPPLVAAWARDRDDALRVLRGDLASNDHTTLLDELRVLLRRPGRRRASALSVDLDRVRDVAGSRLWAAYERVSATSPRRLATAPDSFAALSASTEALDFALEILAAALGPEARPVRGRVAELRDALDRVRESRLQADAATMFVDDLDDEATGSELTVIVAWAAAREAEAARRTRALDGPWRDVTGARVRRGLALSIARL